MKVDDLSESHEKTSKAFCHVRPHALPGFKGVRVSFVKRTVQVKGHVSEMHKLKVKK